MSGGVDDELVERAENAAVPNDYRQLRACVRCHLVLPLKQFEKDGCRNCRSFEVETHACVNFTGVAAILNPAESWIARWLGRQDLAAGCYALEVVGDEDMAAGDADSD